MATENTDNEEELISKGLYSLVSDVIGCESEVKLRRERCYIRDWMNNKQGDRRITVTSGSMAEGFMLKSSDIDMMYWSHNIIVVENYSQFLKIYPHFKTVLMADSECTSPGFVLVKCITRDHSEDVIAQTCVWENNEFWVNTKQYMDYFLRRNPLVSSHGPCQSGEIMGGEYDKARCLKCGFWPKHALGAISRLRTRGWPPDDVIQDMIDDGCLVVPVASRMPLFQGAADLEWRISFSLGEKRLIHSMNHCQFLCYGLWKIFLTEVLKKLDGVENLLCSYFLKTVVIWEIYRDSTPWTPANFASKFLNTLRLLMNFVVEGSCPSFFIPGNNMFYGKVYGEKQKILVLYLRSFYNEGYLCLLKCKSLQRPFLSILKNPIRVQNTRNNKAVPSLLKSQLMYISNSNAYLGSVKESVYELSRITSVRIDSVFISTVLAIRKNLLIQNITERMWHESLHQTMAEEGNIVRSRYLKFLINSLRCNESYLGYGELLLAKAFYLLGDYRMAIKTANRVKSKLKRPTTMYQWNITEERIQMLHGHTHDFTLQKYISQFVTSSFRMYEETAMSELEPEVLAYKKCAGPNVLNIPPLVLANFILFLSHHKTNDVIQKYDVLSELCALVQQCDNAHIFYIERAISWEILGISQQLCGEYSAAYGSYTMALKDKYNGFKIITRERITSLLLPYR